jgi:hypothetical protein
MTYRVIQWYTGEIAQEQIRVIHRHPELELVGAVCFHDDKHGMDVGEIAGIGPIGVKATKNASEALALEADCVLYHAPFAGYDVIPAILASGKNVVNVVGSTYPKATPDYDMLEKACREGQSSLMGSGIHPGLHGDYLPLLATSSAHTINHVLVNEVGDMSDYVPVTLKFMGFGEKIEDLQAREGGAEFMTETYKEIVALVADGAGIEYDELTSECEYGAATRDCVDGAVKKGTVGGIRVLAQAMSKGKPVVTEKLTWYVDSEMGEEWTGEEEGYIVRLTGVPNVNIEVTWSEEDRAMLEAAMTMTAARMINSIPVICEAKPGCRTALDLPVPRGFKPFR